jgi:RNA polymerase sigma factor (sigma-70 family)
MAGTNRMWGASARPEGTDGELIERVRSGDREAYGLLYERHVAAARRFARSLGTTEADADDVVAEVFASVLLALRRGKGPAGSFAPYLMTSIRHECYRVCRRRGCDPTDQLGALDAATSQIHPDPSEGVAEAAVVRVAFKSLPDHFQRVLQRTEIDELSPTEVAGARSSQAIAMTALRARQALASAYLDQHLAAARSDREIAPACHETRSQLSRYVRRALSERRRQRIQQHLDHCLACEEDRQRLGRIDRQLRAAPVRPPRRGRGTLLDRRWRGGDHDDRTARVSTTAAVS